MTVFRVLIADDEPSILDGYRAIFASNQLNPAMAALETELFGDSASGDGRGEPEFDVQYCSQGADAVAAAEKAIEDGAPFSVTFLDIRMPPGMSGVEAAQRIRALDPNLRIVFASGYSDVDPDQIARIVAPEDKLTFVGKPFQPLEIRQLAADLSRQH